MSTGYLSLTIKTDVANSKLTHGLRRAEASGSADGNSTLHASVRCTAVGRKPRRLVGEHLVRGQLLLIQSLLLLLQGFYLILEGDLNDCD
jgi:hypothetical protein